MCTQRAPPRPPSIGATSPISPPARSAKNKTTDLTTSQLSHSTPCRCSYFCQPKQVRVSAIEVLGWLPKGKVFLARVVADLWYLSDTSIPRNMKIAFGASFELPFPRYGQTPCAPHHVVSRSITCKASAAAPHRLLPLSPLSLPPGGKIWSRYKISPPQLFVLFPSSSQRDLSLASRSLVTAVLLPLFLPPLSLK